MEFVHVVPRASLFPEAYPHGFVPFGPNRTLALLETSIERDGFFVERRYAETAPSLKQLIPYSIVVSGESILLLRRLQGGGESRLHGKLSIGVGGHINPVDAEGHLGVRGLLDQGTRREIEEELGVRAGFKIRRVGLINDDSNAVGAVHLGIVQVVALEGTVSIRESEQLEGRLVRAGEIRRLLAEGSEFETWSKLLIAHLEELLPRPALAFSGFQEAHAATAP